MATEYRRTIKCKDYFIMKLYHHPTKQDLKNTTEEDVYYIRQLHAKLYHNWIFDLFTYLTKITRKDCYMKWGTSATDCVHDQLEEDFGIIRMDREDYVLYLVPKSREDIFDRMLGTIDNMFTYKVLEKAHIGFRTIRTHEELNWRRKYQEENNLYAHYNKDK